MTLIRREVGRGHWYQVDGRKFEGVTTLIDKAMPKPALIGWAGRTVAEYVADNLEAVIGMQGMGREAIVAALKEAPWTISSKAKVKGTEVHALAEKLSRGERIEVPEKFTGYVESCIAFLDEWQVRTLFVERPIANRRWRYAGTVDHLGSLNDPMHGDVASILDWKTGGSGVWPEICLQLAAYAHAEVYSPERGKEAPMPKVTHGYGVWLRQDGYDVYPAEIGEEPFSLFLHVAYVARRIDRKTGVMKTWLGSPIQREAVLL